MELPPPDPCPVASEVRPWPGQGPLLIEAAGASRIGYSDRLKTTPAGWPRRQHWCVWVQPVEAEGPGAIWEQRWHRAVGTALRTWQELLPIERVSDPLRAQVRVERRRPPLRNNRASNGRALLQLQDVRRQQRWQREPLVTLLISPGQAQTAIQATTLHELGHAFGLWGHSDQAGDALAVKAGPIPVLELSPRDRATLMWLQEQPGLTQAELPSSQP